jgi:CysZ protein
MLVAAAKALSQILSPPMRSILWKSIGLALVLITVLAIGMQRLLNWAATSGGVWAESTIGSDYHTMINVLSWILSIAAGLGVVVGAIFLMPAITSLVASVFVDDVADIVEREHYPAERVGVALPFGLAITEGGKTALLTIAVYLIALPFVFFAGIGFVVFFIATAWLLGREYFELAAMRVPLASGRQGDAQAACGDGVHRRAVHRSFCLDPDRQPGHAAVRHGLHGPYAQAIERTTTGVDRAGSRDEDAGHLDHGLLRPLAQIVDQTHLAARLARETRIAAVQDQPMMSMQHELVRDHAF